MLMEQLSDLLNMNVEESVGKREFTENQLKCHYAYCAVVFIIFLSITDVF